jgi:hypothetical protein
MSQKYQFFHHDIAKDEGGQGLSQAHGQGLPGRARRECKSLGRSVWVGREPEMLARFNRLSDSAGNPAPRLPITIKINILMKIGEEYSRVKIGNQDIK